jgi:hypothetical protein
MTEIDTFFASSLEKMIRDNLGDTTFHSIQNRLFEKYGVSVTESINDFTKLDSVLREFLVLVQKVLKRNSWMEFVVSNLNKTKLKIDLRFLILNSVNPF